MGFGEDLQDVDNDRIYKLAMEKECCCTATNTVLQFPFRSAMEDI
jgi:hypothetical protein